MKQKLSCIVFLALVMLVISISPIYAGNWKKDNKGWWYQENDGTYPKDDYKYMVHSFYNDLNVKLSLSGDSVTLTKNPDSSFSYGLDYLFEINTLNSDGTLTLPISDFDKIVEDYVNLKYAI